jgi:hypothetical protein
VLIIATTTHVKCDCGNSLTPIPNYHQLNECDRVLPFTTGEVCRTSCQNEYYPISGSFNATCLASSNWIIPTGVCVRDCPNLFSYYGGFNYGNCTEPAIANTRCTIQCLTGYRLNDEMLSLDAECNNQGNWIPPTGFCTAITHCVDMPTLSPGMVAGTCTRPFQIFEFCTLGCDENHTLESGPLDHRCNITGDFINLRPEGRCIPKCLSMFDLPSSTVSAGNCSGNFTGGRRCEMTCISGHSLRGGSLE